MSSIAFVKAAQVVRMNNVDQVDCPSTQMIPCENSIPRGLLWLVPEMSGGVVARYNISMAPANEKPTLDSIRVIHIYNSVEETDYYQAVADGFVLDTFQDYCNNCCGANPEFPVVVIPEPIYPVSVEPDEDGNYIYNFALPFNPNGRALTVASSYFNGVPGVAGVSNADAAALLSWLNTNESAQGTWTLTNSNKNLKLVSTTVTSMAIDIDLIAAKYCFTVPASNTIVDGVKVAGNVVAFPLGTTFDAHNKSLLLNQLKQVINGTFDGATHTELIQYTGFDLPQNLTLAGANVGSTTFAANACSETFNFTIPSLPGSNHYEISAASFNGAPGVPPAPGNTQDFANAAAVLSYATTNWPENGTWTLQSGNTILRLVSTNLDTASVTIVAVPD